MKLAFFVINLDRSEERLKAMDDFLSALPFAWTRVAAIDASRDRQGVLTARGLNLADMPDGVGINVYRGRMVALAEEACFASHMKALRGFLDSDATHGVILEDDVYPLRDISAEFEAVLKAPVAFDIIRCEGSRYRGTRLAAKIHHLPQAALVASFAPCPGAGAYLVTRRGAEKILARSSQFLMPVDDFLVNPGLTGCHTLNIAPWLFSQKGAGSVITDIAGKKRYKVKRNMFGFFRQLGLRLGLRLHLILQAACYAAKACARPRQTAWTKQA